MKRREFITLLGGAAVAWPLAARGQQAEKVPTIGFLGTTTASAWGPWTAAFVQRLRELGWIEGRNLAIEYRWADGRTGRFAREARRPTGGAVDQIRVRDQSQHRQDIRPQLSARAAPLPTR